MLNTIIKFSTENQTMQNNLWSMLLDTTISIHNRFDLFEDACRNKLISNYITTHTPNLPTLISIINGAEVYELFNIEKHERTKWDHILSYLYDYLDPNQRPQTWENVLEYTEEDIEKIMEEMLATKSIGFIFNW